jgi:hypothetical protein
MENSEEDKKDETAATLREEAAAEKAALTAWKRSYLLGSTLVSMGAAGAPGCNSHGTSPSYGSRSREGGGH